MIQLDSTAPKRIERSIQSCDREQFLKHFFHFLSPSLATYIEALEGNRVLLAGNTAVSRGSNSPAGMAAGSGESCFSDLLALNEIVFTPLHVFEGRNCPGQDRGQMRESVVPLSGVASEIWIQCEKYSSV